MFSEVDKHNVVAMLLRGQGDANLLKKEIQEGSPPTESLVLNILDCFSLFMSFMVSSDHLPPQHASSQNMADPMAPSSLKLKKKICRGEGLEYFRYDSPSPRVNDGFSWRKYGQKKIKNSMHNRSYYKCAYKEERNCNAQKRVQKIQDNPSLYITNYYRRHICKAPVFSDPTNDDITYGSKMIMFEKADQFMPESSMSQLLSVDHQENIKDQTMNQEWDDKHENPFQVYEVPMLSPGEVMPFENVLDFNRCDVPIFSHPTNDNITAEHQETIKDQTMNQELIDEHENQFWASTYEFPALSPGVFYDDFHNCF